MWRSNNFQMSSLRIVNTFYPTNRKRYTSRETLSHEFTKAGNKKSLFYADEKFESKKF